MRVTILGRKWFHAVDCETAAVRTPTSDMGKQKARMERVKLLNDGLVARVIADPKPYRERDEAVAA